MANWKAIAIIFIIIAVLEAGFIGWAYKVGTESLDNEFECTWNVCVDYLSYHYDDVNKMCYCYEDHVVVEQEYMG